MSREKCGKKAHALIQANLSRNVSDKSWIQYWQKKSAFSIYLQNGDRDLLVQSLTAIPGVIDFPEDAARLSILSRDIIKSLDNLQNVGNSGGFTLIRDLGIESPFNFKFKPVDLLVALILFEKAQREAALVNAKNAKVYLENIVENDSLADPVYWANLTVCYALLSDRRKMESAISRVRELTNSIDWEYRRKANCELHIAIAYLVLGDHDKAIEILEAANKMDGPIFLNRELDLWFIFDRLKGDPRFDKLLED